jgi:hypothetical protein
VLVCAHDLAEEQGRVDTVQETIRHFGGTIGRLYFIPSVFLLLFGRIKATIVADCKKRFSPLVLKMITQMSMALCQ